jgi:hypothetical protein
VPTATLNKRLFPTRLIEASDWYWGLVDAAIERDNVLASEEEM